MKETIKVALLTGVTLFLMIFTFITFALWMGTSIWWLLTNNMIDRNTFLLICTTTSITLSILVVLTTIFSPEK
jgi:hypothetical protein